jgi:hypothetical protein
MLERIEKSENIFLLDKEEKKKRYLWAFIDECGHTIIQTYSEKYPDHLKKLLE